MKRASFASQPKGSSLRSCLLAAAAAGLITHFGFELFFPSSHPERRETATELVSSSRELQETPLSADVGFEAGAAESDETVARNDRSINSEAPGEFTFGSGAEAEESEKDFRQMEFSQCQAALGTLGLAEAADHCYDSRLAGRIAMAMLDCQGGDAGEGSDHCGETRKMMSAFLQMLPAYQDPALIGTPDYPADRFFAGVSQYLELAEPRETAKLIEAGMIALSHLEKDGRFEANLVAWASYWNIEAPDAISSWPVLAEAASKSTTAAISFY